MLQCLATAPWERRKTRAGQHAPIDDAAPHPGDSGTPTTETRSGARRSAPTSTCPGRGIATTHRHQMRPMWTPTRDRCACLGSFGSAAGRTTLRAGRHSTCPTRNGPPGGDWHHAGWWGPYDAERPWVNCAAMSADRGRFSTVHILGDERLYDARERLSMERHPAARRNAPVWCAHHDRAIADLAWHFVMSAFRGGYLKCLHAPTVAEWLWGRIPTGQPPSVA